MSKATLESMQRRYDRLRDVHSATGELVAIRNLDVVLKEITSRARRLLDCDLVYLNLPADDVDGSFIIHTWSGALSTAYRGTRVYPGAGVGGVVLETGEPFQVTDYLHSDEIVRRDDFDAVLEGSGMETLLAVPLTVHGETNGILFAARKEAVKFHDDDIFILSALATHASIALHNAKVDEEREDALQQLSEAVADSEHKRMVLDRSVSMHTDLAALVLEGAGVPDVLDTLYSGLRMPVAYLPRAGVEDDHAAAGGLELPEGMAEAIANDGKGPHVRMRTVDVDGISWVVTDVASGGGLIGHLVSEWSTDLDEYFPVILERAAQIIALCQLSTQALAVADRRSAEELVTRIVNARGALSEDLVRRAQRHGIGPEGPVVLVSEVVSAVQDAVYWCSRRGGLTAVVDDVLVILVPVQHMKKVREFATRVLSASGNSVIGRPRQGMDATSDEFSQATRALRFAGALGYRRSVHSVDEWGVFSTLFHDPDSRDLDRFVTANIGPVVRYDRRHSTKLAVTALCLLDHNFGLKAASEELGIHANTVAQRASRLDHLMGESWRHQPRAFGIMAALKLHQLRSVID